MTVVIASKLDPMFHSRSARRYAGQVGWVVRTTRRGMLVVVFSADARHLFRRDAVKEVQS